MKTLNYLVDSALTIEKQRIASQIRQSHLRLQGKTDPETEELHRRLENLEKYVDGRIAIYVREHPAYPWFSKVKGIGMENIAKIVGLVRMEQEFDGEGVPLQYADTISSLWKFAGYSVEGGRAPKRKTGEKLAYNSQLRSMCWRVSGSLLKTKGKFYDYYVSQKERYAQRFVNDGYQIVPATKIPKVNGKRQEGEGYVSEGHIHNMALRKMIKLFLACLWLKWREGLGLPLTEPYAIGMLHHNSMIQPDNMIDR